jgi:osmotically-inducible protein OsmY
MAEHSPNTGLSTTRRLEQQLAEAGLQVTVERTDGTWLLTGVVDTEEARQAATDIVTQAVPGARIDNQIDIESLLPTDVDEFVGDAPTAELADSVSDIQATGGDVDPDFTDRPGMNDPIEAAGAGSSEAEDPAESGEVYTPPIDPVITADAHGQTHVLGGFDIDSMDDTSVEGSAMDNLPGDEALADAIRRELSEDSATTDLNSVVAVRNGVAHLRGQVADLDDADNAEAVAARVPGVREVVEELEVAGL